MLQAKERIKRDKSFQLPRTVEERTETSIRLMDAADIPRFNWTIDSETGDITVQSEVAPASVHVWHASTCNTQRRDFRLLNLDEPCECGLDVPIQDLCLNSRVLYRAEQLEETSPGTIYRTRGYTIGIFLTISEEILLHFIIANVQNWKNVISQNHLIHLSRGWK